MNRNNDLLLVVLLTTTTTTRVGDETDDVVRLIIRVSLISLRLVLPYYLSMSVLTILIDFRLTGPVYLT